MKRFYHKKTQYNISAELGKVKTKLWIPKGILSNMKVEELFPGAQFGLLIGGQWLDTINHETNLLMYI